ncbi:MAG: hypothetical protein LBU11_11315 [Zoogloeaceae bacterium]|jgi:hypothetical protein|nr:hypothetical protein [Zoogloeaceae bacterium]
MVKRRLVRGVALQILVGQACELAIFIAIVVFGKIFFVFFVRHAALLSRPIISKPS